MKRYKTIKTYMIPIWILCFAMLISTVNAKAETGTGTVKGSSVNVRSDAGTAASKVTMLGNGDALIVTGSKKDAAGDIWYAVTFTKNGKEYKGYIKQNYVNYKASETSVNDGASSDGNTSPETGSSNASGEQTVSKGDAVSAGQWKGKVSATNVNVRKEAVSGAVIATVSSGISVTVEKTVTGSDSKTWYYISFKTSGNEKKGWIRSDFVKKAEKQQEKESVVEIDVSGILAQEKAEEEKSSEKVTETEAKDNEKNESGQKEEETTQKGIMTGDYVRIRKKAVTGNVICQLNKGTELTIKSEKKASDGYIWYKVSFKYNGKTKTGYVRSDFVKVQERVQDKNDSEDKESSDKSAKKIGTLKGDNVRVRKSPVSGAMICQLMNGAEMSILAEEKGTDNYIWYKISFSYNGETKEGYVRSDFVDVKIIETEADEKENSEEETEIDIAQSEEFEAYLVQQGFPESYKDSLRRLHNAHPEWVFKAVATGLNWEDAVAAESKVGTNLVAKNAITSWKSTEKAAYNMKKDVWYTFDGGAWVAASKEIVSYYMDPRNFLTESTIFQFESLEYEDYQNKDGVKRLLKNSFMSGKYTEPDGKKKSYASTFVKIGKKVGVSPYHLASRCYHEQGKGTSGSISGKVEGYENIFNYYNIGAYASGGNSPIVQGLKYASSKSSGSTNYERPWNTHYKALLGGAQYVAQKYVKVGQNTLYFQKFNVVNKKNGIYRHQYMTNIQAAESEAVKMSKAYSSEDTKLVFYIPVYNNMPETACVKPVSNTNPNNYLASLEIKDQQLTPVFSPETESYDLTVPKSVKKVKISAEAVASTSKVEGTGKVKLKRGENVVQITCTAENGTIKTYTIHIVRK